MTRRAAARQSDITRAIEAAKRAGMQVIGYEVTTGRLLFADVALAKPPPAPDADPFMEGLANVGQKKKGARYAAS